MAKLNSSEEVILKEINRWKTESPGFLSKATELASRPLVWVADKMIPDDVKGNIGNVTEKVVDKLQETSAWTVDPKEVLKAAKEFEINAEEISALKTASIHDLDHVAQKFTKANAQYAAAEGFGTGLIGWPGLIADLPALFTIAMRNLYQVSLSYGFVVEEKDDEGKNEEWETGYMLRVFRVATSSSREEKTEALNALKEYEIGRDETKSSQVGHDYTAKQIGKTAAIHLSRTIITQIVKQTIARKAITSIPGFGAFLTAGFNYFYMQELGETAFNLYRERFLIEKKGRSKVINVDVE